MDAKGLRLGRYPVNDKSISFIIIVFSLLLFLLPLSHSYKENHLKLASRSSYL
jgi:hypothetical protein